MRKAAKSTARTNPSTCGWCRDQSLSTLTNHKSHSECWDTYAAKETK